MGNLPVINGNGNIPNLTGNFRTLLTFSGVSTERKAGNARSGHKNVCKKERNKRNRTTGKLRVKHSSA